MQLTFIGILGEYVTSIHSQVRKRPLVVERERLNMGANGFGQPRARPQRERSRTRHDRRRRRDARAAPCRRARPQSQGADLTLLGLFAVDNLLFLHFWGCPLARPGALFVGGTASWMHARSRRRASIGPASDGLRSLLDFGRAVRPRRGRTFFYANTDWQIRDAVLRDMAANPWPFAYDIERDRIFSPRACWPSTFFRRCLAGTPSWRCSFAIRCVLRF